MATKSIDQIAHALQEIDGYALTLDSEATRYWQLHKRRFEWVARYARPLVESNPRLRILDIGNSFQTLLFTKAFPSVHVDTLGFFDHRFPAGSTSRHYEMDLNDCYFPERWPALNGEPYGFIAFLEVIEHLYTSPAQVLACLKTLLAPDGEILIQTPNAAALKKRLKLLLGQNPYELIRADRGNPGHFREYTVRDLKRYAKQTGFIATSIRCDSYLIDGKRFDRICDRVSRVLPGPFKGGLSVALRPEA